MEELTMKYEILLNNSMAFKFTNNEMTASELGQTLNNENITFFVVGNMMINKQNVTYITGVEVESDAPEYDIHLQNGKTLRTHAENFNAGDLADVLNDRRKTFAVIGDTIVTKNFISLVLPVPAEEPANSN